MTNIEIDNKLEELNKHIEEIKDYMDPDGFWSVLHTKGDLLNSRSSLRKYKILKIFLLIYKEDNNKK